jgi:hypothetical protein
MLYTCVQRFDVMKNLEFFWKLALSRDDGKSMKVGTGSAVHMYVYISTWKQEHNHRIYSHLSGQKQPTASASIPCVPANVRSE